MSLQLARSMRDVLLGDDPPVTLSQRAQAGLLRVREASVGQVDASGLTLRAEGAGSRWWTWAGTKANTSLVAALGALGVEAVADHASLLTTSAIGVAEVAGVAALLQSSEPPQPLISDDAMEGLKFSEALPPDVARSTLAERMTDVATARRVAGESLVLG